MKQQQLNSFLANMFNNRTEFANINGVKNMMDAKYMLIADVVGENIELLSEVVAEYFVENVNSFELLAKEKVTSCAYKR
jgi:hypothetical protein